MRNCLSSMYTSIISQIEIFGIFILFGMNLGLYYDFFKSIRIFYKLKFIGSFITDILFWAVSTIHFILFLLNFGIGQMRFYILFAIIFGIFTYQILFSKISINFFLFSLNLSNFSLKSLVKLFNFFHKKIFIFKKK